VAKKFSLIEDWRAVLRRAYSVRFIIAAGIVEGISVILPLFIDKFPRDVFAALSFCFVCGAFVARFVAQKSIHEDSGQ